MKIINKIDFLKNGFNEFLFDNNSHEKFYKYFKYNMYRPLDSKSDYFIKTAPNQWIVFAFNWAKSPNQTEDKQWKSLDLKWRKAHINLEKEYIQLLSLSN